MTAANQNVMMNNKDHERLPVEIAHLLSIMRNIKNSSISIQNYTNSSLL
jgi:hypothetical protein